MKTYNVSFSMPVHFNVKVQAEDKESAIEEAMQHASLGSFVGNGGIDKLVGVYDECVSLDPGDSVLEGDGWEITAHEVTP
jgi:hypothetical protein